MVVSVTTSGATGDNSTDNRESLERAFDYAKANKEALYFPPGIYKYSGALYADSITISGDINYSILKPTANVKDQCEFFIKGTGTTIHDLTFDGNRTNRTTDRPIIMCHSNPKQINIYNLNVINSPHTGLELNNVAQENTTDAGARVTNCYFFNNRWIGLTITNSCHITIDHCEFKTNLHGVMTWGAIQEKVPPESSNWFIVEGNFLTKNITVSNCVVSNEFDNVVAAPGQARRLCGIFFAGTAGGSVVNNVVQNCNDVGIDFEACRGITVVGNYVKNARNGAYSAFYGGRNLIFANNVAVQTGLIGAPEPANVWSGINIYGGVNSSGVTLKHYDYIFEGNICNTANGSGFYALNGTLESCIIRNNTFRQSRNSIYATVRVVDSGRTDIIGNEIVSYQITGIAFEGQSDSLIKDNRITCFDNNNNTGIYLFRRAEIGGVGDCRRNTISQNRISGFSKSIWDIPYGSTDAARVGHTWIVDNRCDSIHKGVADVAYQGKVERNVSINNPNTAIALTTTIY